MDVGAEYSATDRIPAMKSESAPWVAVLPFSSCMEAFGILGAVPAAFLAAVVYAHVFRWFLRVEPGVDRLAVPLSVAVLGAQGIEWISLFTLGAVECRRTLGPAFYPVHLALFLLSVPALVNLLVVKKPDGFASSWIAIGLLSSALALPLVITQYAVSEALYGVDGDSGPYGR